MYMFYVDNIKSLLKRLDIICMQFLSNFMEIKKDVLFNCCYIYFFYSRNGFMEIYYDLNIYIQYSIFEIY